MPFLAAVFVAAQFMTTLQPETIRAFDEYVKGVDAVMTGRTPGAEPLAGRPTGVRSNNTGKEVSRGILHDWSATIFLPGVRKDKVVALLENFDGHKSIYPEVLEGRVERREANRIFGFHRLRKKKVLEVDLEVRYQVDVLPAAGNRYASRSVATEIHEIEGARTAKERRLPAGHDHGYLWRIQTYWTLEETAEGVWVDVRTISLTRDIPTGLGWVVKPIVRDLPRESLQALMEATKKAVTPGK